MVAAVAALSDDALVIANPVGIGRVIRPAFRLVNGMWTLLVVGYTVLIAEIEAMIYSEVGGRLRLLMGVVTARRG